MSAFTWFEAGCPRVINDPVLSVARNAADHLDSYPLHIVTSDWNLDDNSIQDCRTHTEASEAERQFCDALMALPLAARYSAMAIAEGYVDEDGTVLIEDLIKAWSEGPETHKAP